LKSYPFVDREKKGMKVERTRVYNMRDAIRGMRNPKESWHLSDTQSKFVIKKDRMPSDF